AYQELPIDTNNFAENLRHRARPAQQPRNRLHAAYRMERLSGRIFNSAGKQGMRDRIMRDRS
ncbi:hypothetical protein V3C99_008505, partial [Haemonchus contortus]